jgi:hypothetical protein
MKLNQKICNLLLKCYFNLGNANQINKYKASSIFN